MTTPTTFCQKRIDAMVKTFTGGPNAATNRRELEIECASQLAADHYDYAMHAGNLVADTLQKNTKNTFIEAMRELRETLDPYTLHVMEECAVRLNGAIHHERDLQFDIFGMRTLERAYLLKTDGIIQETPQYMFMRVAVGIHREDIDSVLETYDFMSRGLFTHATPTLFNAATNRAQMSSCFLMAMKDDSITGIFDTVRECAEISKNAGGIGLHVHNIRAKGSIIRGTGGASSGLVPMLRVFNNTARYVDQGGGKRMGSFAIYLEPWHADVLDFIDLKKNHGAEEIRARDLFYALWVPDLFMQRVRDNGDWTLFCPTEARGLSDVWGEQFNSLYEHYERRGLGRKTLKAQRLWRKIVTSQIETGTPYLLFKDACNKKSNQQNLGTIKSSNLCSEIIQYSSPDETAVCNLASIALPKCVHDGTFDYTLLVKIVRRVVRNLDRVIDRNYYPVDTAERSNMRHRPMGIGVQGLADVFQLLEMPFESKAALELNRNIFETMYFAAVSESNAIAEEIHYAQEAGIPYIPQGTYPSYAGCPASRGQLQFDLWGVTPSARHDWAALKSNIQKYGLRNSLLLSVMPTASTSQILGNNECCEPYTSNVYTRRVLSGEYIVANKHLCRSLSTRGLWTQEVRDEIIKARGSVQDIECIPPKLKRVFKTVWEIKQRTLIDMAAARGPYICQSQSMNLFLDAPTYGKVTSMHFYAWEKGLKTGCYYLRTKPAVDAIQFTVPTTNKRPRPDECESCSS